mmetsp:Transcript_7775/g.11844  ORF Transcript_7775/g.11844 Transcript_7775/m.11844 type:complete len:81 (-) Transcript_7775:196-438(-)|eukprot:CAMPEP_0113935830 /NCGR_PEP_ID=MMETSP1339-20121228/2892_1 /TAXON_ID=94617 /ORGANISM="Fibrocapsa japonica" /LENGTH=80 /DNA_ID=CAMNT_0000938111 /DNA_START=71 /DNA_END=313 /DNA_ORIENTATION=+ /assembly_acc=CAM_ASM_000762
MATPAAATAFWRVAGMNYVQYVAKASTVLRTCVKGPAAAAALERDTVAYNRSYITAKGGSSAKEEVTSMKQASTPIVKES